MNGENNERLMEKACLEEEVMGGVERDEENCPTWLWLCPPLLQFYQLFFQDEDSDGSHNLHIWLVSLPHPYPPSISIAHTPSMWRNHLPSPSPAARTTTPPPTSHTHRPPPRHAPPPHTHTLIQFTSFSHISCLVSVCYDIIQYLFTVNKHKMEITQQRNSRTGYYHGLIVFSVWFH